MNRWVYCN